MTTSQMASCSKCGAETKVTIYDSINVSETPDLKQKVLDGSLFVWECPHCGALNLLKYPTLYHDPSEKIMVWMACSEALEDRVRSTYAQMDELAGYTARFVDEVGDLVEKVKIFDSGLDDVVMEMTKYVTKMEICEKSGRAEDLSSVQFRFLRLDGADNEITLAYPLDGQMQMVAVGFNVYEDCRGIVKRNPDIASAASGFCKVDSAWLAQYFR